MGTKPSIKMIKITNNDELFVKMDNLKKDLNEKFKSSIKTNPQLIEYLVDEKILQLKNFGKTENSEQKEAK